MADSAKAAGSLAQAGQAAAQDTEATLSDSALGTHVEPLSPEEEGALAALRAKAAAGSQAEKLRYADSLAERFIRKGRFDSALVYRDKAAAMDPSEARLFEAGEAAYFAYSVAANPQKQAALAAKAQQRYNAVLAKNPGRLDAKTHLALTYVSGPTPMKGIGLLREVIQKDPKNQEALYQLGILSMQSAQYEKAVGRFQELLALYPKDTRARFYLGLAYKELGQNDKARQELELVRQTDTDPAVQATVRDYLAELKTN